MKACAVDECESRHFARGLCAKHYQRLKTYGTTELTRQAGQPCMALDCEAPRNSNGLCAAHYQRLRGSGRLTPPSRVERLVESYAVDANGCWLWQAAPDAAGYGRISIGNQVRYAHRVSYETFIGPIPDGLTIDHLCRIRRCINPTHLEPVTLAENVRRANAARSAAQ